MIKMINDRKAKLCYSFVTKYIFATYDDKIEVYKGRLQIQQSWLKVFLLA